MGVYEDMYFLDHMGRAVSETIPTDHFNVWGIRVKEGEVC